MKRCIYSIELSNVGLCCGVYSNSKRPDGKFWAHFPKCAIVNCPYEHPELLEDAVFNKDEFNHNKSKIESEI